MPISTDDTEPVHTPLQLLLQPLRYKHPSSCSSNTAMLLESVAQADTTNNSTCNARCPASSVVNCSPNSIKVRQNITWLHGNKRY